MFLVSGTKPPSRHFHGLLCHHAVIENKLLQRARAFYGYRAR
jgi:hypothetical protein